MVSSQGRGVPTVSQERQRPRRLAINLNTETELIMKNLLAVLPIVVLLASTGTLRADEARGKIQSIDAEAKSIILDDGTFYSVADGVAIDTLQPDTEVTVTYEENDGQKKATAVTPAQ
jgi:hypothetical protein